MTLPAWTLPDGRRVVLSRIEEHDPASKGYPLLAEAGGSIRSVDHGVGPRLDQGQLGSCTGNEKANALNTETTRQLMGVVPGAPYLDESHAVKIYDLATRLDRFPGHRPEQDTGSSGNAASKATIRLGYMKGSYRWTFSTWGFLRGLQHLPAGCGTVWTPSMFTPDARGYVAPKRGEGAIGGHQWSVYGYDADEGDALCHQSWGYGWGPLNGLFRMRMEVWEDLVIKRRGDVTFLVPDTITKESQQ